jgi:hypothetical protein
MKVSISIKAPLPGFYYSYQRIYSHIAVEHYAYEVIGTAKYLGIEMVLFRPLYPVSKEHEKNRYDLCPLEVWAGEERIRGNNIPRFKEIEDPKTIRKLSKIRDQMYGKGYK